jgi:hypothetical protein
MKVTFYVNWDSQEIYKNDEALAAGYLDYHGGAEMHFNEYLGEAYEPDTLFYATEEKKKEILEKYKAVILEDAKEWATDLDMINTIDI